MTEEALRLVAEQMRADPDFARWVRTDPVRALRDFDMTPEERSRLLRLDAHRYASRRSEEDINHD